MAWASFNRFEIELSPEDAASASHQGQCDDDVLALSQRPDIAAQLATINPTHLAAELQEYGAWDKEELADHTQNLQRILWIAAGNITEDDEDE